MSFQWKEIRSIKPGHYEVVMEDETGKRVQIECWVDSPPGISTRPSILFDKRFIHLDSFEFCKRVLEYHQKLIKADGAESSDRDLF